MTEKQSKSSSKTDNFICPYCGKVYVQETAYRKHVAAKKCFKKVTYTCPFCHKLFVVEKAYLKHLCAKKQRFLERDTKYYHIAYQAYSRFYQLSYRKNAPDLDKFEASSIYLGFIKFGRYVLDINAVDPMEYATYLVKHNTPLADWCKDRIYEQHIRDLVLRESPERALERNTMLMESWAHREGKLIKDFYREIGTGKALQWLRSGRISPWVMLNCQSGQELLGKFSDEQMMLAGEALNRKLWDGKFSRHLQFVYDIQDALKEIGL